MIDSAVEALYLFFQFCHCMFQLQNFCLILFCGFYFFTKLLILFIFAFLILFSCLFVLFCILLSYFKMTILNFFARHFIDLYFFGVSHWSFICFLWWYHICLIHLDLCNIALVSVHLKQQNTSSSLSRLALVGNVFLLYFPWANGITSKISHAGLEPGHEVVAGSTLRSAVGELVTKDFRCCGSYLVSGWMGLSSGPCSVGWHVYKHLLQSLQLELQRACLLLVAWAGVAPIRSLGGLLPSHQVGPWAGRTGPRSWLRGTRVPVLFQGPQLRLKYSDLTLETLEGVIDQVPYCAGMLPHHSQQWPEPSYRVTPRYAVRLSMVDLYLGTLIVLSPYRSLGWQDYSQTVAWERGARAKSQGCFRICCQTKFS